MNWKWAEWVDSTPAKFLNWVFGALGVIGGVGGSVFAGGAKGGDWGLVPALAFGFVAAVVPLSILYVVLLGVVLSFRRDCPRCSGTGTLFDSDRIPGVKNVVTHYPCDTCHGRGKLL